jgi:hypothetical protein
MRRMCVSATLLTAWLPLAVGCGEGAPTQASMRRHALRRAVDDEDLAAPADDQAEQSTPADDHADPPAADPPHQETTRIASRDSKPKQPPAKRPADSPPPADPTADSPSSTEPPGEPLGHVAPPPPPREERPTEPLDVTQRRQRTIDNLTRIGEALKRYTETNGRLFSPSINDSLERPLLSWRVELLPYLGYQDLYDQFHLQEPWNSAHNQPLLKRIPEVYQSPERFDDRTNYLLPIASFTPFSGPRGLGLRRIEDGLPNTVLVLEVDDTVAVPWTKPADLALNWRDFDQHVGQLREDGFFAVWGDGSVTCVLRDLPQSDRHAIFTHDAGDSFAFSLAQAPALAVLAADAAVAAESGTESRSPAGGDRVAHAGRAPRSPTPPTAAGDQANPQRWPVPDPAQLDQARDLVREIYQGEYEKKRSPRDQQALAKRMLQHATQLHEDPAGQYVLLDIARKIATQIGDSVTAWSALEQLLARFDRDALAEQHELLNQVAKKERTETGARLVLEQSTALVETALQREEFDTADSLCQIATGAARQLGDRAALQELDATTRWVQQARKTHREIHRALASLTDADDPQANLLLGRYFCLVKGDWDQGLVFLSRGADTRLQELAQAELGNPTIGQAQLDLAEGWWNLGVEDPTHQKSFHLRAGYWYARAFPQLPTGLWRTKVQLRLNELKQRYGEAAVPKPSGPATHGGG